MSASGSGAVCIKSGRIEEVETSAPQAQVKKSVPSQHTVGNSENVSVEQVRKL